MLHKGHLAPNLISMNMIFPTLIGCFEKRKKQVAGLVVGSPIFSIMKDNVYMEREVRDGPQSW